MTSSSSCRSHRFSASADPPGNRRQRTISRLEPSIQTVRRWGRPLTEAVPPQSPGSPPPHPSPPGLPPPRGARAKRPAARARPLGKAGSRAVTRQPAGFQGPPRGWCFDPRLAGAQAPPTAPALRGDSGFGLYFQEGRGQRSLFPWCLDTCQPGTSRLPRCPGDSGSPCALGGPAWCSLWPGLQAQGQPLVLSGNGLRRDSGIWQCSRAEATEDDSVGICLHSRGSQPLEQ